LERDVLPNCPGIFYCRHPNNSNRENRSKGTEFRNKETNMRKTSKRVAKLCVFVAIISVLGCYPALRKEAETPDQALTRVRFFYPHFSDDMDGASLQEAVEENLQYLRKLSPDFTFEYGLHKYTAQQVIESQEAFMNIVRSNPDPGELNRLVKKHFLVYKAAGRAGNKSVLFTGYFEPVFQGRLARDEVFKYPIYRRPDDLIKIDLSLFREEFKGKSVIARIQGKEVLPYFTRQQIVMGKALKGKDLEIAWLKDPLDLAYLQIQGSGSLELGDGRRIRVGYAEKNGQPYRSIGGYLVQKGLLAEGEASMQSIRRFLSEHPEMTDEVLNYNPSYVFFRNLGDGPSVGSINVPITAGRTIALDSRLFPPGALAFITTQKPVINEKGEITGWEQFSRFVLNQDTGGAIRGAGRADLFCGSGPHAEVVAGHMKHEGQLYILIKKPAS
jgi:membrane-bound lytic murein transglycosylase A